MTRLQELAMAYSMMDHAETLQVHNDAVFDILHDAMQRLMDDIHAELSTSKWKLQSFLEYVRREERDSPYAREIGRNL